MAHTPRILLLEDEDLVIKALYEVYGGKAVIVAVTTLEEAEGMIEVAANTFDVAIVDACLGGNGPNTLRLPKALRQYGFKGRIIGFSSDLHYLPALKGAGCDLACHKAEIFREVDKVLAERPISSAPPSK